MPPLRTRPTGIRHRLHHVATVSFAPMHSLNSRSRRCLPEPVQRWPNAANGSTTPTLLCPADWKNILRRRLREGPTSLKRISSIRTMDLHQQNLDSCTGCCHATKSCRATTDNALCARTASAIDLGPASDRTMGLRRSVWTDVGYATGWRRHRLLRYTSQTGYSVLLSETSRNRYPTPIEETFPRWRIRLDGSAAWERKEPQCCP